MSKILPILSILILFSCDKLLQKKQMYSVEITSCLFKDGDFNRSEITGNPLPIYMYVYENEFLIWKAKLGKYRGSTPMINRVSKTELLLYHIIPNINIELKYGMRPLYQRKKDMIKHGQKDFLLNQH